MNEGSDGVEDLMGAMAFFYNSTCSFILFRTTEAWERKLANGNTHYSIGVRIRLNT